MIKEINNKWDVHYFKGAFMGTLEGILLCKIPDDLKKQLEERLKSVSEIKINLKESNGR